MSYIAILTNHMRSVKAWADAADAEVRLDMRSFALEAKCRNRYYVLKPRFMGRRDGRMFYTETLVEHVVGFVGWLPYGLLRDELSDDKLAFKAFAQAAGLRVPATWQRDAAAGDFLLKRSVGSFGYEITGPYRKGAADVQTPPLTPGEQAPQGQVFAEQFVQGDAVKVWFWGERPFFAHRQPWPRVLGDGRSTVAELAAQSPGETSAAPAGSADHACLQACIAFQDLAPGQVLAAGRSAWLDFRYGRTHASAMPTPRSDNQLDDLPDAAREQAAKVGAALAPRMQQRFGAPVLYAVDGVLDAQGEAWWLEMNTNPAMPPDAYPFMFASLFPPVRKA